MDYKQLSKLSPLDYLDPWRFVTGFDSMHTTDGYPDQQFQHGLEIGQIYLEIHISYNSVWSASDDRKLSSCSSHEGIGYHACTAPLLRGFLMSPAAVWVHRRGQEKTLIKPAGYWLDAQEGNYSVGLVGDASAKFTTGDRNQVVKFFQSLTHENEKPDSVRAASSQAL